MREYPGTFDETIDVGSEDAPPHSDEGTRPKHEKIRLVHCRDLQLPSEPPMLVQGVIPRRGITVVWGPHKSGKSFWSFDLACHVALGWNYRDRRVVKGPVIYCAFEGSAGYPARFEAFKQEKIRDSGEIPDLYIETLRLDIVRDHTTLIEAIRKIVGKPVLIVLDTLNRSIPGSDSDDEKMRAYVAAAEAIVEAFDCAVIIIHHSGWNTDRMRGSTVLPGAMEAEVGVRRNASDNVIAAVMDARDFAAEAVFASELKQVEVGRDENGTPISSCVIQPIDIPADAKSREKSKKKRAASDRIALRALDEAIYEAGETVTSNHIPPNVVVVQIDLWRDYALKMGISNAKDRGGQLKAFNRAYESLVADKVVGVWHPHAWPVTAPLKHSRKKETPQ